MLQPLTNPDALRHVLAAHNLTAAKSLGQNFLVCEEVNEAILMGLTDGPKQVTELGPGLGTLTQSLLGSGFDVRAIEKDDEFVQVIPKLLTPAMRKRLTLIHGDLVEIDWSWEKPYSIVGNIPYNLSGMIIRLLTKVHTTPHCAIFLMQKEVADRITLHQNSMSLVGLAVGLWGRAELLLNVPSSCFIPSPAVQSAVVQIRPHSNMLSLEKRESILAKSKPFFQAKRKQLAHTLKAAYGKDTKQVEDITRTLNISPTLRPENLSVENWITLCDIL